MTARRRRWSIGAAAALAAGGLAACGDAEAVARGPGLEPAALPPAEQAAAYEAAIRAGFDVAPGLTLLLSPAYLPRTAGYTGGPPVAPALLAALEERGVVQGTCAPDSTATVPRCDAPAAGYVLRLSELLAMPGDTVQLYLDAERYARPQDTPQEPFRFETAYQLVRRGGAWAVAREGRVPDDARRR